MRRGLLLTMLLTLTGTAPSQTPVDSVIFEFHSGFWLNLHQFLYQQASAPGSPASDSPEWREAVDYYRNAVVPRGQMSDDSAAVNNRLSAVGSAAELPSAGLSVGLVAALTKAAPLYRRVWWPEHSQANRTWIDAVEPLLSRYGEAIRKDISAAYQVTWPAGPIRVDVSAYAGPLGAYTTPAPTHITISSTDAGYQGTAALEMLFHEVSHTLDEKLQAAIAAELAARGRLFRRRRFEHAIIFYTAGELTRRYMPGYEPYGVRNGMWTVGWPGGLPVLEKDWKPYLDGRLDWGAALRAIVSDYGVPRKAP
jgi:hypothetical protein